MARIMPKMETTKIGYCLSKEIVPENNDILSSLLSIIEGKPQPS